jgi:hypothetical protein
VITGDLTAPKSNFRFTPESGLKSDIAPCPFRASNGLMHRSKQHRRSITSSARIRTCGGTVRRFTINSTVVDCYTGRSAGYAPFRFRPTYIPAHRYELSASRKRPAHEHQDSYEQVYFENVSDPIRPRHIV